MRTASWLAVALAALPALCLADSDAGRKLHAQKCVACHAQKFGGDGSAIYLRPGRLVHDRAALGQRVSMCSAMINSGWFPEDEAAVADYLAAHYYKFKESK
jgi:mono/diheme cytochrome c family protein